MERISCVLIQDDVLEFLDEIEQRLTKKLICCNCPNPCDKETTRCAIAIKNLLTDIHLFTQSYTKHNNLEDN